jgi:hypothetical protein
LVLSEFNDGKYPDAKGTRQVWEQHLRVELGQASRHYFAGTFRNSWDAEKAKFPLNGNDGIVSCRSTKSEKWEELKMHARTT